MLLNDTSLNIGYVQLILMVVRICSCHNNKGADQPADLCSLIKVFIECKLDDLSCGHTGLTDE